MIEEFLRRMRSILPDFRAYEACLQEGPFKGIRTNTLKIRPEELRRLLPFAVKGEVSWEPSGFYIDEEKPGKTYYHDAGLFYVQEPSAMCAVPLLDVQPGDRVLDLCAAPGGKATQIAQAMQGEGILVLNEKIPDRAKILLQNAERMGVCNAVIMCADPEILARRFAGYFDKILVDAPCSGEGMMRKEPAAAEQWSEETVKMCAARQKKIMESAAMMLAPDGTIVYSTCTFSREEDEDNADWFVREHPEFVLEKQIKLYPHREKGEGHFAAKFRKTGGEKIRCREEKLLADKKALAQYRAFESEFLLRRLEGEFLSFGEKLCLVPKGLFSMAGLKVLRAGLLLGESKGNRFEPAHALALGISRENFANVANLNEEEAAKYLRGEELTAHGPRGWCVAAYNGFPLGLGKNGDVLKNHYPKGLRRKQSV